MTGLIALLIVAIIIQLRVREEDRRSGGGCYSPATSGVVAGSAVARGPTQGLGEASKITVTSLLAITP